MKKEQPLDSTIVTRYKAGESAVDIAKSLGVVRRTVYNALARAGVERKRKLNFTTDEQQQEMIALYQRGAAAEDVAERFGVDRMTVYNVLKRFNIQRHQKQVILSEAQRIEVARTCVGGVAIDAVAANFGVSRSTVCDILRDHGISLQLGRPRVCEVDDGAFDVLTPESLYWMGFLFADGCVHRDRDGQASLVCGLAVKDLGHLEKLRAFCKSTHKIRHYTAKAGSGGGVVVGEREHVYWRVRSNRICDALERRGIVTKRTRVPVPELAESRDFWRGCVDGDGWLGYHGAARVGLCGQQPLLQEFQKFVRVYVPEPKMTRTRSGIWTIDFNGAKAEIIIRLLYENASVYLERKHERALAILSPTGMKTSRPYKTGPQS